MKPRALGLLILGLTLSLVLDAASGFPQDFDPKGKGGKGKKEKGPAYDPASRAYYQQAMQWEFERKDANEDRFLTPDEMEGKLRDNLSEWDVNRDGRIDWNEYQRFFTGKMEEKAIKEARKMEEKAAKEAQKGMTMKVIEEVDPDRRPVMYRAGKLPKELPSWFAEMDRDNDGQVSFFEWRKVKNHTRESLSEYGSMDRNSDGLLTAQEVLRFVDLQKKLADTADGGKPGTSLLASNSAAFDKKGKKDNWKAKDDKGKPPKKEKKPKL